MPKSNVSKLRTDQKEDETDSVLPAEEIKKDYDAFMADYGQTYESPTHFPSGVLHAAAILYSLKHHKDWPIYFTDGQFFIVSENETQRVAHSDDIFNYIDELLKGHNIKESSFGQFLTLYNTEAIRPAAIEAKLYNMLKCHPSFEYAIAVIKTHANKKWSKPWQNRREPACCKILTLNTTSRRGTESSSALATAAAEFASKARESNAGSGVGSPSIVRKRVQPNNKKLATKVGLSPSALKNNTKSPTQGSPVTPRVKRQARAMTEEEIAAQKSLHAPVDSEKTPEVAEVEVRRPRKSLATRGLSKKAQRALAARKRKELRQLAAQKKSGEGLQKATPTPSAEEGCKEADDSVDDDEGSKERDGDDLRSEEGDRDDTRSEEGDRDDPRSEHEGGEGGLKEADDKEGRYALSEDDRRDPSDADDDEEAAHAASSEEAEPSSEEFKPGEEEKNSSSSSEDDWEPNPGRLLFLHINKGGNTKGPDSNDSEQDSGPRFPNPAKSTAVQASQATGVVQTKRAAGKVPRIRRKKNETKLSFKRRKEAAAAAGGCSSAAPRKRKVSIDEEMDSADTTPDEDEASPELEGSKKEENSDADESDTDVKVDDVSETVKEIEEIILANMCPKDDATPVEARLMFLQNFQSTFMPEGLSQPKFLAHAKVATKEMPRSVATGRCVQFIKSIEDAKGIRNPLIAEELQRPSGDPPFRLDDFQCRDIESLFHLMTKGPTNGSAVLGAPTSYGKTPCSIRLARLFFQRRDLGEEGPEVKVCCIFTKQRLIPQWVDIIHRVGMDKSTTVQVVDLVKGDHQKQRFDFKKALYENLKVFLVIPEHYLGLREYMPWVLGTLSIHNVLVVADEAHAYLRHPDNQSGRSMAELLHPLTIFRSKVYFVAVSATLVINESESQRIISNVIMGNFPSDALGDDKNSRNNASKILSAMTRPDPYSDQDPMRSLKPKNVQYKFMVMPPPPPPRRQGEDGKTEDVVGSVLANRARFGTGVHPFEYPPALYAIVMSTVMHLTFDEDVLVFYNSVEGLVELERSLELTPEIQGAKRRCRYYFMHGEVPEKNRDKIMEDFKINGGVFFATPAMLSLGTNAFAERGVHIMLTVGAPHMDSASKLQAISRLVRRGQTKSVVSVLLECDEKYTHREQEIVDRKDMGNAAKTGQRIQTFLDNSKGDKIMPLEDSVSALVGLMHLLDSEKGLVYNIKNEFGVSLDPDSDQRLFDPERPALRLPFNPKEHSERYWDEMRAAIYKDVQHLNHLLNVTSEDDEEEQRSGNLGKGSETAVEGSNVAAQAIEERALPPAAAPQSDNGKGGGKSYSELISKASELIARVNQRLK